MLWNIYLSGEIHSDWRQQLKQGCEAHKLSVEFTSAVTNHEASDSAGDVLGGEESGEPLFRAVYGPRLAFPEQSICQLGRGRRVS